MTRRRTEASRKLRCYNDRAERKRGMRVTVYGRSGQGLRVCTFQGRFEGYLKWRVANEHLFTPNDTIGTRA